MSEMYDEKPKKKKREANSTTRYIAGIIAILILSAIVTVIILAILGPTVGNVYSNIGMGLIDPNQ